MTSGSSPTGLHDAPVSSSEDDASTRDFAGAAPRIFPTTSRTNALEHRDSINRIEARFLDELGNPVGTWEGLLAGPISEEARRDVLKDLEWIRRRVEALPPIKPSESHPTDPSRPTEASEKFCIRIAVCLFCRALYVASAPKCPSCNGISSTRWVLEARLG